MTSPTEPEVWTESDQRDLDYLYLKCSEARDQIIHLHNMQSYSEDQLKKEEDPFEIERYQRYLKLYESRARYERSLIDEAKEKMHPLLDKKERVDQAEEARRQEEYSRFFTKKHVLLKAILADELMYCFDTNCCDNETWQYEHKGETREDVYLKRVQWLTAASLEEIVGECGTEYDHLLENQ